MLQDLEELKFSSVVLSCLKDHIEVHYTGPGNKEFNEENMQQQKFQFHNIPYNAGIKWREIQSSRVNMLRENMHIKLT